MRCLGGCRIDAAKSVNQASHRKTRMSERDTSLFFRWLLRGGGGTSRMGKGGASAVSRQLLERNFTALSSKGQIGMLLFTTSILLWLSTSNAASLRGSGSSSSSSSTRLPFGLHGLFGKKEKPSAAAKEEERGELYERGASSSRWRQIVSLGVEEDEDEEKGEEEEEEEEEEEAGGCEIEVINNSNATLIFCWINGKGELRHYTPICSNGEIKDGSVSNRHVEYSRAGHAFCCLWPSASVPQTMNDVLEEQLVFVYRPRLSATATKNAAGTAKGAVGGQGHRHVIEVKGSSSIRVECLPLPPPSALIDNTKMEYQSYSICGFGLRCEEGVFEKHPAIMHALRSDLEQVRILLPQEACKALQKDTLFYVNCETWFGFVDNPVRGRSCTFHSKDGGQWLKKNGFSALKAGCIEIYNAADYIKSREVGTEGGGWGLGGGLLHELCHAFHDKCVPGGFDNAVISNAYLLAMSKHLYDAVPVHGSQGANGPVKAYACANCMEFFAELSTAYMWCKDDVLEYNKWFPFNRAMLRAHDEHSFSVIDGIWQSFGGGSGGRDKNSSSVSSGGGRSRRSEEDSLLDYWLFDDDKEAEDSLWRDYLSSRRVSPTTSPSSSPARATPTK